MARALLFDLDDTLVVDEAAAQAAFAAAAELAASRHALDATALALAARRRARMLWRSTLVYGHCARIGISSWEGLWCRFAGDEPSARWLRNWSPTYRRETWRLALADQGVEDRALADELAERFAAERRARHEVYPDVEAALGELAGSYALGLVTNGASCLQREKLAASGLGRHFAVVVVSGDLGVGKPDARVFRHALAELGARDAVMIGDSLERDIAGALAAGLGAVWVNRDGRAPTPGVREVRGLAELGPMLAERAPGPAVRPGPGSLH